MARKFLYIVTGFIMLALASSFVYRFWGQQLIAATMVPTAAFAPLEPLNEADYARPDMWIARPDRIRGNPALWVPRGYRDEASPVRAATFFVHPTTHLAPFNTARWNMALDDGEAQRLAAEFAGSQASAFSAAGNVWAPRYRQAHFGAFLTSRTDAAQAIDAAYRDVATAFQAFLRANPNGPIILAGHSQGSLHLMRLMHEQVAGKPLAARIAAAYIVGWPVSIEADLPALGLPPCTRRGQDGCVISWQSFAEPASPVGIEDTFVKDDGFTGKPRRGTHILCVNPLTGSPDSAAAASQNLGTLAPGKRGGDTLQLVKGAVPARCDRNGFLLIGNGPDMGSHVLPGNNYHVYDYALFWANVRRDAKERLATFLGQ